GTPPASPSRTPASVSPNPSRRLEAASGLIRSSQRAVASTPKSVAENSVTKVRLSEGSGILESHRQSTQPWDWWTVLIQGRGAEDRIVRAFLKANHDPVRLGFHDPSGRDEALVRLLPFRFVVARPPCLQPPSAR